MYLLAFIRGNSRTASQVLAYKVIFEIFHSGGYDNKVYDSDLCVPFLRVEEKKDRTA